MCGNALPYHGTRKYFLTGKPCLVQISKEIIEFITLGFRHVASRAFGMGFGNADVWFGSKQWQGDWMKSVE